MGKMFLSAVLAEGSVGALLEYGRIEHLFKANEIDAYEFVREFVKEYQSLPSEETIEAHTGTTLMPHVEPAAYYHDLMELRHTELSLKKAMKQAGELFLPENKDIPSALQLMTNAVMELASQKVQKQVVDFRHAYEIVVNDYASKWNLGETKGLHFGWPYIDAMTGGLGRGDVASFVGRPAAGKTWQLLYAAHSGWNKAGKHHDPEADQSRLFVSMEIGLLPIQQRLAAMQTHVPALKLKNASLGSGLIKNLKSGLAEIQDYGAPFWVVDGNLAATVEDIWALARQLKPGAIFIDGAYLVKHPTERDRFRRVAENAELIKQELAPIAPTVCSWQFAKSASKKNAKKGEKVTMDDIGYTDAIAQVSSLVLGLFQEDSVETIKQRKVEVLKGRNGETGSFSTAWDFETMDFTEIVQEDVEDLQFL
ncbi:DnaB-like helicase C-terminal domain-containing protein [Nitratireductor sp. OM-1]|nr:DnaB-like helicase C-terminal domain-containing protein [Nitratireductor sp. OM-1]